ncbi:MAG: sulfatase [Acidobacteria bacterium]|nr:sulfatase [Acidobacteriota bacterium]
MVWRRHAVALPLTVVLLVIAVSHSRRRGPERPRNLLLITLDTMRADRLPVYGFAGFDTPALDRIASDGIVFEEAFAAVPLTLPSHASLFTGIYPPRLAVRDNAGAPLSPEFTTLAESLRRHGLRTAAFVASAVLAPGRGLEQGFDLYSAGAAGRCPGIPTRRRAVDVVDEATTWLRDHDSEPFFTWIHLFDTHRPYDLPDEYKDRHFDPYVAAIQYEDAQIARLITHLESRDLLKRTIIVVAGDHGESLGDHGEEAHGIFLYQEVLRVPFLMRGPGVPVGRSTSLARLVDLTPTVLNLFGITVSGVDGVNLLGAEPHAAPEVYAESMYPLRFGWAPLRSLRADRYKFIDAPRAELYDLATDPGEERNVVKEHPTVAEAMRRRLRTFDPAGEPGTAATGQADKEVLDRIASLGYVGQRAASPPGGSNEQVDPKDRIAEFNRITLMQWQHGEQRRALCR